MYYKIVIAGIGGMGIFTKSFAMDEEEGEQGRRRPCRHLLEVPILGMLSGSVEATVASDGPLYVKLKPDRRRKLVLVGCFDPTPDGGKGELEISGKCSPGDALVAIGGHELLDLDFEQAIATVQRALASRDSKEGITLTFRLCDEPFRASSLSHPDKCMVERDESLMETEKRIMLEEVLLSNELVDEHKLRALCSWGVPEPASRVDVGYRPLVWRLLLGCLPFDKRVWHAHLREQRQIYSQFRQEMTVNFGELELAETSCQDHVMLCDINKDLVRTLPDLQFFTHTNVGRERFNSVRRILFIFGKLNPGVRYVQGMNEIVCTLFYVISSDASLEWSPHAEADTFFCFNRIMSEVRDLFVKHLDHSDSGLHGLIISFRCRLQQHDQILSNHLSSLELEPTFYVLRWFTTLLSREFMLPDTIRLWDTLFSDTAWYNFLSSMAVCMVIRQRDVLLRGDFASNLKILQGLEFSPADVCDLMEKCRLLRQQQLVMPPSTILRDRDSSPRSVPSLAAASTWNGQEAVERAAVQLKNMWKVASEVTGSSCG
jgi:hypothetical protein